MRDAFFWISGLATIPWSGMPNQNKHKRRRLWKPCWADQILRPAHHIHVNHALSKHLPNNFDKLDPVVAHLSAKCSLEREDRIHLTREPWMQVECQKILQKRRSVRCRHVGACFSKQFRKMLRKPLRDKGNKRSGKNWPNLFFESLGWFALRPSSTTYASATYT